MDGNGDESDYSKTKWKNNCKQAQHAEWGHDISNTEDEDEDKDEDLQEDVDTESDDIAPPSTQPHHYVKQSHKAPSTADKGKGKATSGVVIGKSKATSRPGPLPDNAIEEAQAFSQEVMDAAEELAACWHMSWCNILIAAGLVFHESRRLNSKNKHAVWYAVHHPIEDGSMCLRLSCHFPPSYQVFWQWTPQNIVQLCWGIIAVAL